jgi:hypothetical protein
MAVLTRDRFDELVEELEAARNELQEKHPELASTLADGTKQLRDLVEAGDLDAAEEWAQAFWRQLLESPTVRGLFGTKAPHERPIAVDRGLEQTKEAVEKFNDAVREIVGLIR